MTYQDIYGARSLIAFVTVISFIITFWGTWKKEHFLFSAYLSVLVAPSALLIFLVLNVLYSALVRTGISLELLLAVPVAAVFLLMGIHVFLFYVLLGLLLGIPAGFLIGVLALKGNKTCQERRT